MKKLYFLYCLMALFTAACTSSTHESADSLSSKESEATVAGNYGATDWTTENAMTLEALIDTLQQTDSIYTTVSGSIDAACQAKGCWMSMKANDNELFVKFKDYGFFVPMNSAGHEATMKGWAYAETQSIEDQIEYKKDAEASEAEIAAVTTPIRKLTFMAEGVVIK